MKEREKVYGGNLKTVVTHKLALAGDKYTWHLLEICCWKKYHVKIIWITFLIHRNDIAFGNSVLLIISL